MKKNKLNILFIGPIPPSVGGSKAGGVATHLWELAKACNRNGYNVFIFTTSNKGNSIISGINIINNKSKSKSILSKSTYIVLKITRYLKAHILD